MNYLPLDGIRIMDMTAVIGPPYGMLMLADMGAEVIRVESTQSMQPTTRGNSAHPIKELLPSLGNIGGGYPDYEPGERPWNRFGLFNCVGHNKMSMTVDLRRPEGLQVFERMLEISDVLIENMPGVLDSLGLGYARLSQAKPDIIMLSISGMGATGPYRKQHGMGMHFEDMVGHGWIGGYQDERPSTHGGIVPSDAAVGAALASIAVAALHYRLRTGRGQYIDMAMGENFMHHLAPAFMDCSMNGRIQTTTGNRHPFMAPHGCYPCKGDDRWVTIAIGTNEEWEAFKRALGSPDWAEDSRFATSLGRWENQDDLDWHIIEWTKGQDDREVQTLLQGVGVAAGSVMNNADIFQDPHLRARGFFKEVTHREAGTHEYPFNLWHMSKTKFESRMAPPCLGEHNEYVYRELLGVSPAEYEKLEAEGHIGLDYAPHVR